MGMDSVIDLKLKWQHEKLTAEQMIGQLLQHIEAVYEKQRELGRENRQLTKQVAALDARMVRYASRKGHANEVRESQETN